jgi:hypothetical protein
MKKLKVYIICAVLFLCGYLYLDFKTYYYGLSRGLFNQKLPNNLEILFAGSDLGNQGMILKESDMNLHIVRPNDSIYLQSEDKSIFIKKFTGYWVTDKNIIVNIKDKKNRNRYFEISVELVDKLYPNYIFKEFKILPNESTYVDLDKSLIYFKGIKLMKNSCFILFVFMIVSLFWKHYFLRKKNKI